MGEYTSYEWLTVSRELKTWQQDEVRRLSSHISVTPTSARVDYDWGSFKHDPEEVLAKYFDAFLYADECGDHQLTFCLPARLVDLQQLERYSLEPYSEVKIRGKNVLVGAWSEGADGETTDCVRSDDLLSDLASLRGDLLSGDLRFPYLAWLSAIDAKLNEAPNDDDEPVDLEANDAGPDTDEDWLDRLEPPVPAGLKELTPRLRQFIHLLGLDEILLSIAAQVSKPLDEQSDAPLREAIGKLSNDERSGYLRRLFDDEPLLSASLRHRLRDLAGVKAALTEGTRTARELLGVAEAQRQTLERLETEAAAERHRQYLADLAEREPGIWVEIAALLVEAKPKSYDKIIDLLTSLRELADHRGSEDQFFGEVAMLRQKCVRKPGMLSRLDDARSLRR